MGCHRQQTPQQQKEGIFLLQVSYFYCDKAFEE
jgi:hypothetical protein